jgi:hypothetical protein
VPKSRAPNVVGFVARLGFVLLTPQAGRVDRGRSVQSGIARIDAEVSYTGPDRTISGGGLRLPDPYHVRDRGRGAPGAARAFDDRRIGFAIRYIPTTPARTVPRSCAARIAITHFMPEPQPSRDLDPEFVALHRTITERNARILYRGTEIASYNEPKALAQRG